MSMENSIFQQEPEKEANSLGKKTRIADKEVAHEYYDTALKLSPKEKGTYDPARESSKKEMGENLNEQDYEKLDEVLKKIRENSLALRLDINWNSLSRKELMKIYLNAEKIAKDNPSDAEKIAEEFIEVFGPVLKKTLALTSIVALLMTIDMIKNGHLLERINVLTGSNLSLASISEHLLSSYHF